MALINCPECNHQVSDKAYSCPSCGFPIEELVEDRQEEKSDSNIKVEFELEDDEDGLSISNVNGILVDIGKLLEANHYEVNTAARTLNCITRVGIVPAKEMVCEFIDKNPEYNKAEEFKAFIQEQATLTRLFNCNQKIGKLFIDHDNQLFSIGFWSYIYKFEDVKTVRIKDDMKLKISLVLDIDHINTPQIQINMPITKDIKNISNIKSLRSLKLTSFIISRDESMRKAVEVKGIIEELKKKAISKNRSSES